MIIIRISIRRPDSSRDGTPSCLGTHLGVPQDAGSIDRSRTKKVAVRGKPYSSDSVCVSFQRGKVSFVNFLARKTDLKEANGLVTGTSGQEQRAPGAAPEVAGCNICSVALWKSKGMRGLWKNLFSELHPCFSECSTTHQ